MKFSPLIITTYLILCIYLCLSHATDIYVNPTVSEAGDCGNSTKPCLYLSTALDKSHPGDRIILQSGVYAGPKYRKLVIDSTELTFQADQGASVTIDAQNAARIFTITNSNVTLDRLNFVNGYVHEDFGGIIFASINSNIEVKNCTFMNSTAEKGGAIYLNVSRLSIEDCKFENNIANNQGGALSTDATYEPIDIQVYVSITRSTFARNKADFGGALSFHFTNAIISETTFTRNVAEQQGGAIGNYEFSTLWSYNNILENNTGIQPGGAFMSRSAYAHFFNTTFQFNQGLNGGAIMSGLGSLNTLSNCIVNRNSALNGGGIYVDGGSLQMSSTIVYSNLAFSSGGGLFIIDESSSSIHDSRIESNRAEYGNGGGVYAQYRSTVTIKSVDIISNSAHQSAGGIFCSDSTINITSSNIEKNKVDSGSDDTNHDLYCSAWPNFSVCTIYENSALPRDCGPGGVDNGTKNPLPLLAIIGLSLAGAALILAFVMVGVCIYWKRKNTKTDQKAWKQIPVLKDADQELLEDYE